VCYLNTKARGYFPQGCGVRRDRGVTPPHFNKAPSELRNRIFVILGGCGNFLRPESTCLICDSRSFWYGANERSGHLNRLIPVPVFSEGVNLSVVVERLFNEVSGGIGLMLDAGQSRIGFAVVQTAEKCVAVLKNAGNILWSHPAADRLGDNQIQQALTGDTRIGFVGDREVMQG